MEVAEKKKQMVPELRFREFEGEWVSVLFSTFLEEKNSLAYGVLQPGNDVENGVPMLRTVDLDDHGLKRDTILLRIPSELDEQYSRTRLAGGELIISVMGTLGRTIIVPNEWSGWNVNRALAVARLNDSIVKDFLVQIIRSPRFEKKVIEEALGSAQKRINLGDLKDYKFTLPTLPEQKKIADFLSAVDTRIKHLNRKKELLEQYKKGVMQKLFNFPLSRGDKGVCEEGSDKKGHTPGPSQEGSLRFKRPDGTNYPDWEEKRLGKLTFKVGKKNKENIQYPIYSINNQEGFRPQSEQFDGLDSNERGYDISMYKIVHPKTFAYNPARINVGSIGYSYDLDEVIVSSLYVCFQTRKELEDLYLLAYLDSNSFKTDILRYQEGGVRQYLFYENFSYIKVPLPSIEEQQKIADFLSALDKKIEVVSTQIAKTQQFKKGLLQKMFV